MKVFFHPGAIDLAVSQVTAVSQTLLRTTPGTNPPFIEVYSRRVGRGSAPRRVSPSPDLRVNVPRTPLV